MTSEIVPTQTATPGVDLIYLPEKDVAGIHYSGLARLLGCDAKTVSNTTATLNLDCIEELEVLTPQGLRTVNFILEAGVIQVLKAIRKSSRIKQSTRDSAEDLYDRFAVAGFKLYTMLQVAPVELKEKVDKVAKEFELTQLKIQLAEIEKQREEAIASGKRFDYANNALLSSMATMHGADVALALTGKKDQIVERECPTTEVIDETTNQRFYGQSLKQIADYLQKKHGIRVKSGAEVSRALIRADRADLIEKFPRRITGEGVKKEDLDEVYRVLLSGDRQKLIGE